MAAAAHDPKFAKKVGVPVSVAKEFNDADAGTNIRKRDVLSELMDRHAPHKNAGKR